MKKTLSIIVSLSLFLCGCGKVNESIEKRETMQIVTRTIPLKRFDTNNTFLGDLSIDMKCIRGKSEITLSYLKKLVPEDQCNITEAFYYNRDSSGALKGPVKLDEIEGIKIICDCKKVNPTPPPSPTPRPTPTPTRRPEPIVRKIQISYINEKNEILSSAIIPVRVGEGKTTVSIDNFKALRSNITKAFYIKEGTRKALTEKHVTLNEIDSIEVVCKDQESNLSSTPVPSPLPASEEGNNEHKWVKIAVGSILAVGTIIIVFRVFLDYMFKKIDLVLNDE